MGGTQTPNNNALPITGSEPGLFGNSGVWERKVNLTLTTTQEIQGDEEDRSNPVEIKFTLKNSKGGEHRILLLSILMLIHKRKTKWQQGILGVKRCIDSQND